MKQLALALVIAVELVAATMALNGLLDSWWIFDKDPIYALLPDIIEPEGGVIGRLYWLALFLMPVTHWAIFAVIAQRERSVQIQTSASESVSLRKRAIEQYVAHSLGELSSVLAHRIRVKKAGDGIDLRVELTLAPGDNIPAIQADVERVLRSKMANLLGPERVHKIRVVVRDFGSLERSPVKAAGEAPAPRVTRETQAEPDTNLGESTSGAIAKELEERRRDMESIELRDPNDDSDSEYEAFASSEKPTSGEELDDQTDDDSSPARPIEITLRPPEENEQSSEAVQVSDETAEQPSADEPREEETSADRAEPT